MTDNKKSCSTVSGQENKVKAYIENEIIRDG
jgi:hypothetical protein